MQNNVNRLVEAVVKVYEHNKLIGRKRSISEIYDVEADKLGLRFVTGLKSLVMKELNKRSQAAKAKKKIEVDRKNGKIFPGWHFTEAQIKSDTERCQNM